MALSQRQMVPTDREYELHHSMGLTAGTAGKVQTFMRVGYIEDEEANRRRPFGPRPAVVIGARSRAGEAVHRSIPSLISPPIRTARLGTVPSTGSGGEL